MVARGLSEAKPLWRPEGGRESQLRTAVRGEACLEAKFRGREGVATKERLSEAKPLWRPAGGREGRRKVWRDVGKEGGRVGGREGECLPGSLSGGSDSRGKRVRGGERRERDGHRCEYRQQRRNLNTSPETRGLLQSEGHYRSYSLYSPLSMPLIFWPCLSVCVALYHILFIPYTYFFYQIRHVYKFFS